MRVTPAHAERKSAHTTAPVDTAVDGGTTTMVDAFLRTVERRGEAPAILDADPRVAMSWRDYGSYARRMAACVATLGLAKGDTLGLLLTNRPEFHVADAGALMLGVTPFSMYNTSSPEQLAHLISDADCPVIVTGDALVGRLRAALKDSKANVEYLVVVEDLSWHELLSHKAIEAIPDVGPHDSDAVADWLVQLGAGLLAAVLARAVADPAQLAAMATMPLTGPSLMAAFAVDVATVAAEDSRKQAGV